LVRSQREELVRVRVSIYGRGSFVGRCRADVRSEDLDEGLATVPSGKGERHSHLFPSTPAVNML
jgi:hypothetical protein